jgi:hypothetical protein
MRIGVTFGLASGDDARGDDRLGTFDPLYPNLGYFTDAPVIYPSNSFDIRPSVALNPDSALRVTIGTDFVWRADRNDAIYVAPGLPVLVGNGAGGRFLTALSDAKAAWRIAPHLDLSAAYVHGIAGNFITSNGGRDLNFFHVMLAYRF